MPFLAFFWFWTWRCCCCCACIYCLSLFFSLSILSESRVGFSPDALSAAYFEELFCVQLFSLLPPFWPLDWGVLIFLPFPEAWFLMLTMFVSDEDKLEFICNCLPSLLVVMSRLTEPLTRLPPPLELSLSCLFKLLPSLVSRFLLCISWLIKFSKFYCLTCASWNFALYCIICFFDSSLNVIKNLNTLSIFESL